MIRFQQAVIQFHDLVDDVVEEDAIVGDDNQRTLECLQVFLEPDSRFDIEMVGRLIEQAADRVAATALLPAKRGCARRRRNWRSGDEIPLR